MINLNKQCPAVFNPCIENMEIHIGLGNSDLRLISSGFYGAFNLRETNS